MTRRSRRVGLGALALLILFVAVKFVPAEHNLARVPGGFSDAPFGPFAGYAWIGNVRSIGASFTVPRITSGSSEGAAGTWIGAQGQGPPSRFVQIGAIEGRYWSPGQRKTVDADAAFWSDTARHYRPDVLFPVSEGDVLSASLTLANGHWALAVADARSRKKTDFSIGGGAGAPFNQAEWTQEHPGNRDNHAAYPQMAAPVFSHLTVNSSEPEPAYLALFSQWMSVNHGNLSPTAVRGDSFTLQRAPAVSAAALQYLRISKGAAAAFQEFETERSNWTPKTPFEQISSASLKFLRVAGASRRALLAARWPGTISGLVRSYVRSSFESLRAARPPAVLTAASFAAWNSTLTAASQRAGGSGSRLRLALGLPGLGFVAERG